MAGSKAISGTVDRGSVPFTASPSSTSEAQPAQTQDQAGPSRPVSPSVTATAPTPHRPEPAAPEATREADAQRKKNDLYALDLELAHALALQEFKSSVPQLPNQSAEMLRQRSVLAQSSRMACFNMERAKHEMTAVVQHDYPQESRAAIATNYVDDVIAVPKRFVDNAVGKYLARLLGLTIRFWSMSRAPDGAEQYLSNDLPGNILCYGTHTVCDVLHVNGDHFEPIDASSATSSKQDDVTTWQLRGGRGPAVAADGNCLFNAVAYIINYEGYGDLSDRLAARPSVDAAARQQLREQLEVKANTLRAATAQSLRASAADADVIADLFAAAKSEASEFVRRGDEFRAHFDSVGEQVVLTESALQEQAQTLSLLGDSALAEYSKARGLLLGDPFIE